LLRGTVTESFEENEEVERCVVVEPATNDVVEVTDAVVVVISENTDVTEELGV
jgi:hypothetical protein